MSFERGETTADVDEQVLTSALAAALAAGIVAGILLQLTGRMASVAAVYGLDGVAVGWVLVLLHSLVAGGLFAILVVPLAGDAGGPVGSALEDVGPFGTSTVLGVGYGLVLWIVGVALLVPLLLSTFEGADRPLPYLHGVSLLALLAFGLVLGVLFALLYERGVGSESELADPL